MCRAQAEIAQLVEHFTRNEGVEGSSPFFGLEKDLVNILSVFIRSFAVAAPSDLCIHCTDLTELLPYPNF